MANRKLAELNGVDKGYSDDDEGNDSFDELVEGPVDRFGNPVRKKMYSHSDTDSDDNEIEPNIGSAGLAALNQYGLEDEYDSYDSDYSMGAFASAKKKIEVSRSTPRKKRSLPLTSTPKTDVKKPPEKKETSEERPQTERKVRRKLDHGRDDVKTPKKKRKPTPKADDSNRSFLTQAINVRGPTDRLPPLSTAVRERMRNGKEVLTCPYCEKKYCQRHHLNIHIRNFHFTEPKQLLCEKCDRVFKHASVLKNHYNNAECERKWEEGFHFPSIPKIYPPHKMLFDDSLQHFSPTALYLHYTRPLVRLWLLHTNRRGAQLYPEARQLKYKEGKWNPVTITEGYSWLKCTNAWSMMPFKHSRDPWRKGKLFRHKFFTSTMSGNRYNRIKRASTFCDPVEECKKGGRGDPTSPAYEATWRVADLLEELINVAQNSATPGPRLTADELIVAFGGRTRLVSYMPSKPTKHGVVFYALSDPKTGYLFNLFASHSRHLKEEENMGILSASVVALVRGDNAPRAAKNHLHKGITVITDRLYTRYSLMEWLKKRGTWYVGTVRSKRRSPSWMENDLNFNGKKMRRGEMKMAKCGSGITLTAWKDSKMVLVASTMPMLGGRITLTRRKIYDKRKKIYKGVRYEPQPYMTNYYASEMGGTDLGNQLIASYHFQFKSRRWTLAVFTHAMDICLLNAFTAWKYFHSKARPGMHEWSIREFKLLIIYGLDYQLQKIARLEEESEEESLGDVELNDDQDDPAIEPMQQTQMSQDMWDQFNERRKVKGPFHHKVGLTKRVVCFICKNKKKMVTTGCGVCRVGVHDGVCSKKLHKMKCDLGPA